MATLQLQFNCLCLFVTDHTDRIVHVLMPAMAGHPGHAGHDRHIVRVLHRSFPGNEKLLGRPMEGWALTVGKVDPRTYDFAAPDADLTLRPPPGAVAGGVIPNLTALTPARNTVDGALLRENPGSLVSSRITLRSGRVSRIASEATWKIAGKSFALAHQVTWEIPSNGLGVGVQWQPLNGVTPPTRPFETLDELEPEDDLGYRLRVFHVTEAALPPRGGVLNPETMREHYRAFFPLLGITAPADALLPQIQDLHINQINCGAAGAGSQGP